MEFLGRMLGVIGWGFILWVLLNLQIVNGFLMRFFSPVYPC